MMQFAQISRVSPDAAYVWTRLAAAFMPRTSCTSPPATTTHRLLRENLGDKGEETWDDIHARQLFLLADQQHLAVALEYLDCSAYPVDDPDHPHARLDPHLHFPRNLRRAVPRGYNLDDEIGDDRVPVRRHSLGRQPAALDERDIRRANGVRVTRDEEARLRAVHLAEVVGANIRAENRM